MCVRLSHLKECAKNRRFMCCRALCDMHTVHECCKTTAFISQQTSLLQKGRGEERTE